MSTADGRKRAAFNTSLGMSELAMTRTAYLEYVELHGRSPYDAPSTHSVRRPHAGLDVAR